MSIADKLICWSAVVRAYELLDEDLTKYPKLQTLQILLKTRKNIAEDIGKNIEAYKSSELSMLKDLVIPLDIIEKIANIIVGDEILDDDKIKNFGNLMESK